jgi:hypothetical protein
MSGPNKNDNSETHPLFPSGEWEGFFMYGEGPGAYQNKMSIFLTFQQGMVSGGGSDTVGAFSWNGDYDTSALWCRLTKSYQTHKVFYDGKVDEKGIWGSWEIFPFSRGGFHIWPKKSGVEHEESAENAETEAKVNYQMSFIIPFEGPDDIDL